jgi:hypothetical protein
VLLLPAYGSPLGVVTLTVGATAVGFTSTNAPPQGSSAVVFSIEGNPVRFRWDGTDPTATTGVYLAATDTTTLAPYVLLGYSILTAIRFIAVSSSATLWAAFCKV